MTRWAFTNSGTGFGVLTPTGRMASGEPRRRLLRVEKLTVRLSSFIRQARRLALEGTFRPKKTQSHGRDDESRQGTVFPDASPDLPVVKSLEVVYDSHLGRYGRFQSNQGSRLGKLFVWG